MAAYSFRNGIRCVLLLFFSSALNLQTAQAIPACYNWNGTSWTGTASGIVSLCGSTCGYTCSGSPTTYLLDPWQPVNCSSYSCLNAPLRACITAEPYTQGPCPSGQYEDLCTCPNYGSSNWNSMSQANKDKCCGVAPSASYGSTTCGTSSGIVPAGSYCNDGAICSRYDPGSSPEDALGCVEGTRCSCNWLGHPTPAPTPFSNLMYFPQCVSDPSCTITSSTPAPAPCGELTLVPPTKNIMCFWQNSSLSPCGSTVISSGSCSSSPDNGTGTCINGTDPISPRQFESCTIINPPLTPTPIPPTPTPPGTVMFNPNTFNFESLTVGQSATQVVTITNNTGHTLNSCIVGTTGSGNNVSFTILVSTGCETLTNGASCNATVKVTPNAAGTFTGNVTLTCAQ